MIKVTFLGTSGPFPSIKRNHPAMLLTYDGENILVDCGEGTQRQFRMAGISPTKVTRILVTHWHGDHVLGIPGLIQTLSLNGYKKTLFIYGPKGIKRHMKDLLTAFPSAAGIKIEVEEVNGKFFENDEFYLESKLMVHGIPCNAYCFVKKGQIRIDKKKLQKSGLPLGPLLHKLKEGKDIIHNGKKYLAKNLTYLADSKKICFVMDSMANKNMHLLAKDADALIIESTYDAELHELAREHKHMTSKQAAEIAKESKVKKLILTHLSERYDKDPLRILSEAQKIFKNTFLAKDLDVFEV
jgi:ribonuclease Z